MTIVSTQADLLLKRIHGRTADGTCLRCVKGIWPSHLYYFQQEGDRGVGCIDTDPEPDLAWHGGVSAS